MGVVQLGVVQLGVVQLGIVQMGVDHLGPIRIKDFCQACLYGRNDVCENGGVWGGVSGPYKSTSWQQLGFTPPW